MKYYNIKSMVASSKLSFNMRLPSNSFYFPSKRDKPYIEPGFEKVVFETEKPSVLLISAVGATGKTALAEVLAYETSLPLLDLSKHKPVGDNTLTGLITSSFKPENLSEIFIGFNNGTYGVIIDGIDEGRSKTTEQAFEAFLDDLARLCSSSSGTTFVLLGRTKILEDSWLYLTDKGVNTALVTISPFDLNSAQQYIDQYTGVQDAKYQTQYEETRDHILHMLGRAFVKKADQENKDFL